MDGVIGKEAAGHGLVLRVDATIADCESVTVQVPSAGGSNVG